MFAKKKFIPNWKLQPWELCDIEKYFLRVTVTGYMSLLVKGVHVSMEDLSWPRNVFRSGKIIIVDLAKSVIILELNW